MRNLYKNLILLKIMGKIKDLPDEVILEYVKGIDPKTN